MAYVPRGLDNAYRLSQHKAKTASTRVTFPSTDPWRIDGIRFSTCKTHSVLNFNFASFFIKRVNQGRDLRLPILKAVELTNEFVQRFRSFSSLVVFVFHIPTDDVNGVAAKLATTRFEFFY
mmetsp:Transcript_15979/g.22418  ORF Transcript_15979/g.22418 Transcript_15979/m.22418 type:complete len:121 (+) Transcript_15979:313-675(+)